MTDTLTIHELAVDCRLGISEAERANPQTVWIDMVIEIDAARAAARDAVEDALDYARLVSSVKALVDHSAYRLLETLAEAIASRILTQHAVSGVLVRVKKRPFPDVEHVAVEILRHALHHPARRPGISRRR